MYFLKVKFMLDGIYYHTKGFAPCTEEASQKGKFSENYIKKCACCIIGGYMEVKNLEGNPELIDWSFEHVNG